jgi:hypothetical protein
LRRREVEVRRRDTDNGVRDAIEADRPADDARKAS